MARKFISARYQSIAFTAAAALHLWTSPAAAYVVQISAASFVQHGGQAVSDAVSEGALAGARGSYFAAVNFPKNGDEVCRFSLVYGDSVEDRNLTARLYRKVVELGESTFEPPIEMARASSTGANPKQRRADDTSISSRTIAMGSSFYFVELEIPSTFLNPIGVQIEVEPNC